MKSESELPPPGWVLPVPVTARPVLDDDVALAAAQLLAPAVLGWLRSSGDTDATLEDVTEDLGEVDLLYRDDGYDVARKLEEWCAYSSDSELVRICDDAGEHLRTALNVRVRAWLPQSGLRAPALAGDVMVRAAGHTAWLPGVIVNIYPMDGRASVRVPELGHVSNGPGTHGLILPWEEIAVRAEN